MPLEVHVGDVVTMRKTHPCGSRQWVVYRIGADIGLKCQGCGRRVMLPRRQFERAAKHIAHSAPPDNEA
ncbi:MAG: DUF951 domain-containing protein [Anaerolineae bacterium]|nr:DUF951 domain-containing protein [Anaerolineae bacterium]